MENQFARRPWLLPVVLAALVVLLLRPAVLPTDPSAALSGHDFTGNFYPLYGYTTEQVLDGELPLWNPRQFAGFPVAGNPQASLFYPATWGIWGLAALGISVPRAMGVMVIVHVALAAWGFATLGRRLGLSYTGALAAAIIYATSGWAGARLYAGHYTILTTYAWLPWVLAGYLAALERRTLFALLPAMGALGAMALAGHPQMVLYAMLGAVMLLAYLTVTADEDDNPTAIFVGGLWRLALIAVGGVILGMALVLPTAELTGYSARSNTDIDFVNEFALMPEQLVTLALPFLYGNPTTEPSFYWGSVTFEELSAYAGLLPLVALLLLPAMRDKRAVLWIGLVAVGLVLAVGADGVLFGLLVRWVPGFSLFRAPGRFLFFVMTGLAGGTGLLITYLQAADADARANLLRPALRAAPWAATALFIGSTFFSGWYASASHVEPMPHRARQIAGLLGYTGTVALGVWGVLWLLSDVRVRVFRAGIVCGLVLITFDAWRAVVPIMQIAPVAARPLYDGATGAIPAGDIGRIRAFADPNDYFRSTVNSASLSGHLSIEGYDPLSIEAYTRLLDAMGPEPQSRLADLLGVRYVVSWEPREDAGYDLIGVQDGSITYENTTPFPRAWVTVDGELLPNDTVALQRIVDGEIDLRRTVVLNEPLDCDLGAEPAAAEITEYRPNDVMVRVDSDGGVLVLSDTYFPGWQAAVDGEHVPIVRAYTAFRAVCVPPGEHTVTFAYRPASVVWGAVISGVGWLVWGVGIVIGRREN
ncbi:MAG: YfhO family protein [Chloroflexota bacterium]